MKQLRFVAKEVAELEKKLEAAPFDDEFEPREIDSPMFGVAAIYPSRSDDKMEYRCVIRHEADDGWMGMCACPGWGGLKKASGAAKPCIHIFDKLKRHPDFDLEKEIGGTAADAAQDAAHLEKVKAEAKKALGVEPKPAAKKPRKKAKAAESTSPDEKPMKLWASSYPLLEACPASNVQGECLIIRTTSAAASLGTIVHEACEKIIGEGLDAPPDMSNRLEELGINDEVNAQDCRIMSWKAFKMWHGDPEHGHHPLKDYFQSVTLEERFEHRMVVTNPHTGKLCEVVTAARIDCSGPSHEEGHWLIGDWKSNRKEDEPFYQAQLKMNAVAIMARDRSINKVSTIIPWLRHAFGPFNPHIQTYSREDLREWIRWMVKRRIFWDGVSYTTGDHCTYCPRIHVCEGRKEELRGQMNVLSTVDTDKLLYDEDGRILEPDEIHRRLMVCSAFRKVDKAFTKAAKDLLAESGPLPLAKREGYALTIREKSGGLEIDAQKAWPILLEFLAPEQLVPALSMGKKALEDAVKGAMQTCPGCNGTGYYDAAKVEKCPDCGGEKMVEVYPRGKKTAVWEELLEKLKESGAATEKKPAKEIAVMRLDALESGEEEA